MQKKLARFIINAESDSSVGYDFALLPGAILDVQHFDRLVEASSDLAIYAEMGLSEDKGLNVKRTFHVYKSGAMVADGHIHVASAKAKGGNVYHLYENVGTQPENNRIVNLPRGKNDPRPLVELLDKYGDDLFEISIVDCPKGVTLLEGARAPIEGVISVLQMYNGLYGYEIAHVVEEVIQTGSTRHVSHLVGEARVRTDIRVVTKAEQTREKESLEKAAPAKRYLYTMTMSEFDSGQVISQDLKLTEESMVSMLRMMCQVPLEDMALFINHIHQYSHGIAISRDDSMKKYKVEVTGVEEIK